MPADGKFYRVFIASPGGLSDEREAFKKALNEYNECDAVDRGAFFLPVGWELTLPGVGRPQALINEDIEKSDYFVLLLWDRWGSPTHPGPNLQYSSGVEEEYQVALTCFADDSRPMRQLVIFFKSVDERQLSDPGSQLVKVLDFKRKLETEKHLLFETFDDIESFRHKLRRNLAAWLRDHEKGVRSKVTAPDVTPAGTTPPSARATGTSDALEMLESPPEVVIEEEEKLAQNAARGDQDALFEYATLLFSAGRNSQASASFERVLSQNPAFERRTKTLLYLARIALDSKQFVKAERLYNEVIRELEASPQSIGDIAAALLNLSQLYRLTVRYREAEDLLERTLSLREQEHPTNQAGLAFALYQLSNLYLEESRFSEAKPLAERAVSIREEHFAKYPNVVVPSILRLVAVETGLARYTNAGALLQRVVTLCRRPSPVIHARRLLLTGVLLREQGRYVQAKRAIVKAVALREKAFGPESPMVAGALAALAELLTRTKRYSDAEVAHRRSLMIRQRNYGANHPELARSFLGLGRLYLAQGATPQAERLIDTARQTFQTSFGDQVPLVARCEYNLAQIDMLTERFVEAEDFLASASTKLIESLGLQHPDTVSAVKLRADALRKLGRSEEAQRMSELAADGFRNMDDTAAVKHSPSLPE